MLIIIILIILIICRPGCCWLKKNLLLFSVTNCKSQNKIYEKKYILDYLVISIIKFSFYKKNNKIMIKHLVSIFCNDVPHCSWLVKSGIILSM